MIAIGETLGDFDEMQMRRLIIEMVGRYRNAAAKELNDAGCHVALSRGEELRDYMRHLGDKHFPPGTPKS